MEVGTAIALGKVGAIMAVGIAGIGSALGTGAAGAAAIGAWKRCYDQNKAAPFMLLAFVGAPLSQTIYGMVLMFIIDGKAKALAEADPSGLGACISLMGIGLFAGLAIAASAWLQGKAGAGGSHALAETGKGFTNYLAALGIIETVAIFVMVLAILLT